MEAHKWGRRRRRCATFASNLFILLNLTWLCSILVAAQRQTRLAGEQSSIRLARFDVPAQARPGEWRKLKCDFELDGATLHAMKLFKDNKEFYRYTGSEQRMNFQVAGVSVDMKRSNQREVWLHINRRSGGIYKCQVSVEHTFNSVSAEKTLEVLLDPVSPSVVGGDNVAWSSRTRQQPAAAVQQQHNNNVSGALGFRRTQQQQQQPVRQQQAHYAFGAASANTDKHSLQITTSVALVAALLLAWGLPEPG